MSSETTTNRWNIVIAAIAIQLCLGVIYAWSPIKSLLTTGFGWSHQDASLPFSVGLATFAVVMVLAGRWQDKVGPRKVATAGGILYGLGYILASAGQPPSMGWIVLTYGIIGGAGIGLAYVCPIAALVKWFPDKRGLISGLAVAGFGAGAFIFSKLIPVIASSPDPGIYNVFLYFGITFVIVIVAAAQWLKNPPEGYKPEGWEPPAAKEGAPSSYNYEWGEMLGTKQFWLLWLMFIIGATAGLMTIGHIKGFSQEVLTAGNIADAGGKAITIVGMLSIFNGLGRIVWGAASDNLGRTKAMMIMFLLQAGAMFGLTQVTGYYAIMGVACLVGFNFGGNFALFPSATADFFGTKNIGINYGWVFTSYGVAGIFGPMLGGYVKDTLKVYDQAFLIAAGLCVVAALLALITSAPAGKEPEEEEEEKPAKKVPEKKEEVPEKEEEEEEKKPAKKAPKKKEKEEVPEESEEDDEEEEKKDEKK
ncbi:MAG: OFA family MFS transporter [Methanopyri archaeon]|nr:OFA family MFS transporter [Methanopyri archaeon]